MYIYIYIFTYIILYTYKYVDVYTYIFYAIVGTLTEVWGDAPPDLYREGFSRALGFPGSGEKLLQCFELCIRVYTYVYTYICFAHLCMLVFVCIIIRRHCR